MRKDGFVSDFSIRGFNKVLSITSLNNVSAHINGFMERWIILLIDSIVNPFLTILRYTMLVLHV